MNPHLEFKASEHEDQTADPTESIPICLVSVELLPNSPFEEVQVSLIVEQPLEVYPKIHFVQSLEDTVKFDSQVSLGKPYDVVSLELKVTVSSITSVGVPRVLVKTAQLPLKLAMNSAPPSKESLHKVTLNINQQAQPLSALFPGENRYTYFTSFFL